MRTQSRYRRAVGLIELLIVTAILGFFAYIVFKHISANPPLDAETKKTLSEHGIDTSNYGTIINTTKSTLNDISKTTSSVIDSITGSSQ